MVSREPTVLPLRFAKHSGSGELLQDFASFRKGEDGTVEQRGGEPTRSETVASQLSWRWKLSKVSETNEIPALRFLT